MAVGDIKAGSAYVELLLKRDSFIKGLANASQRLNRFGSAMKRIGSFGLLGGGFGRLFAGAGAAAALAYPVKLAANLEVATAQFTALTGSAEEAAKIVAGIERFSSKSLISVEELQRSSQLLLGYGMAADQVLPSIEALAEISRGNEDRFNLLALAFGQVTAKTRLYAAEVRQFVESGFNPLQQIAATTGETMKQVTARLEAGGIAAAEVSAALQSAVGPGGRFNGLLDAIGKTATGSFARLWTGIKLAIRPLGEALLPAIKSVLAAAQEWLPAFAAIVKQNARLYVVLTGVATALLGTAAAMTSLGLAVQVTAFGMAGLATLMGLLLNPITLVAGAVAGLAYWFATSTEWGQKMASSLGGWFYALRDIAVDAFGGIADALAAGDLALAGKVAWAGLRLAWLEGTNSLRQIWTDFKDVFMRTTLDIVFTAQEHWARFISNLQGYFVSLSNTVASTVLDIGAWLNKIGATEAEKKAIDTINRIAKAQLGRETDDELAAIEARRQKALADIEASRKIAAGTQDANVNAERDRIQKELEQARKDLDAIRERAAIARAEGGLGIGGAPAFNPADFNMDASKMKAEVFGTFSAAAAVAQGGGGANVTAGEAKIVKAVQDQTKETKKVKDVLAKGGFLLP